jgi:16S rRNA (adenine1518-N6/adenine1519-N6)-dimethyltransferase
MAKRSLGQNFLMHPRIAERIVHAANLSLGSRVLEIGPGTGMLTRALLKEGHDVIAVEADGELAAQLAHTFADEIGSGKLTLVHEDIRKFAIATLPEPYALVANIPYYITGEIMRMFLTAERKPSSMTLLVQKEVAERIARPGKRPKESLLSLSVKAYGVPRYCFTVPSGAFRPAPKVDSAVISIHGIDGKAFKDPGSEKLFFDLLHAGFAHKRKLVASNLGLHFPIEKVRRAFEAHALDPKARSEDLSLQDWRNLVVELTKK